ncbi:hypothetical protein L798_05917 [Zootermopsis nevadensis]|uniref:Uncharacterized protein n=1 Tax=Zootermopsis nevadensis TaxID=136037 RepID=A0A067R8I3_ZOONE|nr:hypothetical protein L798_05917 [Zootermopsis nevadensis]
MALRFEDQQLSSFCILQIKFLPLALGKEEKLRRYMPQDSHLSIHHHENLNSSEQNVRFGCSF